MLNLSDKDIDRLSRDAAEFYEPEDSMLSWNRLEQNLTRQIPERPPDTHSLFRIRPLVWGPAVLLLAGITYFIIKNAGYSTHSTLKDQTENLTRLPADHSVKGAAGVQDNSKAVNPRGADGSSGDASKSSASGGKISSGKESSLNASARETASADNSKTDVAKTASRNGKSTDAAKGNVSALTPAEKTVAENRSSLNNSKRNNARVKTGEKISSANNSANNNPNASVRTANDPNASKASRSAGKNAESRLHSETANKNQRQSGEEPALNNTAGNIPKELSASPAAEVSKQNGEEQMTHEVHLPSLVVSGDQPMVTGNDSSLNRFAALNAAQKPALSKSLQINHSLTIGVVMGPDYTNAGGMANDQLSNNLGISLGYYLTSRLSVNTGFSYTTKFYWTDGKSFQPQPQNTSSISAYAAFPRIESVNGSSNIYEIPLTLRYDLIRMEKTRLFVSAGLSSYLIRKQEYTYFFHNAGRPYEWQNTDNSHLNYWFSVGNFSAGIEHDLGRGFSFQFEPFVRTPFRGMGAGDMKLNSFGMLFSIRYSPVLGRTRK